MTQHSRPRLEWFIVVPVLGLVVLIFWPPPFRNERVSARGTACLSNLKQLATANQIYLTDFDNRFPPENWADATEPYRKNEDLLNCPENFERGGYGYAMNTAVVGNVFVQPDMDRTVLYFETEAKAKNLIMNLAGRAEARHSDRFSNVAYCDTSGRKIAKGQRP